MARKQNDRVKRPNQQVEYTLEQIAELERCSDDVVHFCKNYVKVRHPVKGSIPLVLYPYQEKMMRLFQTSRYSVVLSARQTGKCSTANTTVEIIDFSKISDINIFKKLLIFLFDRNLYDILFKQPKS